MTKTLIISILSFPIYKKSKKLPEITEIDNNYFTKSCNYSAAKKIVTDLYS